MLEIRTNSCTEDALNTFPRLSIAQDKPSCRKPKIWENSDCSENQTLLKSSSHSLPTSPFFRKSGDKMLKAQPEIIQEMKSPWWLQVVSCWFFCHRKHDPFCYSWLEILFTLHPGCQNQNILTWMLKSGDVDTANRASITIHSNYATQIIWMCINLTTGHTNIRDTHLRSWQKC